MASDLHIIQSQEQRQDCEKEDILKKEEDTLKSKKQPGSDFTFIYWQ